MSRRQGERASVSAASSPLSSVAAREVTIESQAPAIRSRLERAVATVCPAWLADRRDDLVQAALVRVLELDRRGEGKRTFSSSYLWRVAYSSLIDEIRKVRRRQEVQLDEVIGEGDAPAEGMDPAVQVGALEVGRGIQTCLGHLVDDRRRAVTVYLLGNSVPETAKLLSWSVKRTENLVYRGLADLRKCLRKKGLVP